MHGDRNFPDGREFLRIGHTFLEDVLHGGNCKGVKPGGVFFGKPGKILCGAAPRFKVAVMDQDAAATDFIIFIIDAVNNGKIKISDIRNIFQQCLVCLKVDQLMADQLPDFFKIFEPSHIKALGKAVGLISCDDLF